MSRSNVSNVHDNKKNQMYNEWFLRIEYQKIRYIMIYSHHTMNIIFKQLRRVQFVINQYLEGLVGSSPVLS